MPQFDDQNVNGQFYSNFNGNHVPKNERISLNQQFYNTHSPSATLTPGRKSASPHFFYSNDTTFMKNSHNEPNHRHFNSNYHHIQNNHSHNSSNYNQTLNLNGNGNSHNNHVSLANQSSNNLAYQFGGSFNHENYNLKIPTTPTRSKSLSPSLRCVIQPPKLRYKQENIIEKKNSAEKLMNGMKSSNGMENLKNINAKEHIKDKVDALNKKDLSASPYLFEPISNPPQNSKVKTSVNEIKEPKKHDEEVTVTIANNDLKKSLTVNKIDESSYSKDKQLTTFVEPCNKESNLSDNKNISLQVTQSSQTQNQEIVESSFKKFVNITFLVFIKSLYSY
jgi:hypothetical protein